ncbi:MAG: outer membrane lipoprotein-sorting protein [Luteolibacter sp.]
MKILLCLSAILAACGIAQASEPSARDILAGARMSVTLTQLDDGLRGYLRKDRVKTPVVLFLKGEDIQFQFSEQGGPWQGFHMRIGDDSFRLYEIADGKRQALAKEKMLESIAGTDLTYEDLAMRFFYWPDPVLEGREKVAGQECYKIRINKPEAATGRYDSVYVWVHTKFGAFMRIRGHDSQGALVREFQVEDVMQVAKDVWTIRKMQVASHDPQSGRRSSLTDVTFDSPNQAKPRGLR